VPVVKTIVSTGSPSPVALRASNFARVWSANKPPSLQGLPQDLSRLGLCQRTHAMAGAGFRQVHDTAQLRHLGDGIAQH
jgi:hypothetical protein